MGVPNGYTSAQVVQAVPTGINSALVFIARTTFTTATSLAMTNVFSSTYENYLVQVTNLVASADAGEAQVTLGTSGTSDAGSNYDYSYVGTANGSASNNQTLNATHWKMLASYVGETGYPSQLNIILSSPNLARASTCIATNWGNRNIYNKSETFGGSVQTSTQYTDFFLSTAGTPTHSCTITVYGIANS
jgi:hypothetical protein